MSWWCGLGERGTADGEQGGEQDEEGFHGGEAMHAGV